MDEDRVLAAIGGLQQQLETMAQEYRQLVERTETNLLTAFHEWARTYEVRARGTSAAVRDFDERLNIIEERLSRLERGEGQKIQ